MSNLKILRELVFKNSDYIARFSLFIIFFLFGILKVLDLSPATPLVNALFDKTLKSFINFRSFAILFGFFECFIGILFLIRRFTNIAVVLFFFHLIATTLSLIILPDYTWSKFLVPTFEGQFIIKNLALMALVIGIWKDYAKR